MMWQVKGGGIGPEVGSLPGLGAFSHGGGSAFGATAHAAVHGAFMTLPPYTRTSEGEVHSRGLGVRYCSHSALSDPCQNKASRIERACTSAEGTARCTDCGAKVGSAPRSSDPVRWVLRDTIWQKKGEGKDESDSLRSVW
jgi:hypothetical protein